MEEAVAEAEPTPDAAPARDMDRVSEKAKEQSDGVAALEALGYISGEGGQTESDNKDVRQRNEPVWDWGATTFLSNDDSMSLASAQRLLYTAQRGMRPKMSEIRPHELLNYFSFDTAAVPAGQTFSVHGSAEQVGDTLSVALAVQGAVPERQPLDLTVVLDRSGSMSSDGRMAYTRRGLLQMSESLQDGDRIDIVLFESSVCTPLENFVVGRDAPAILESVVNQLRPLGSTDLDAGLREAYRIQTSRTKADVHLRNRRVMLITDANLNRGNVNEDLVSEVGKRLDEDDIRLTGIGVGRGFNDTMLNKLTEKGKGAYVYLGSEAVVDRVFGPGFNSLTATIAHNVHFSLDLPDSLAIERFYGEESSKNKEDVQPINYFAGTSQVFLQDLKVRDGSLVRSDPVVLTIEYREATTGEPAVQEFRTTVGALVDADPRNVNKAQALMSWTDIMMARAMGSECGAAVDAYAGHVRDVGEDAEIDFLNGLTETLCRTRIAERGSPGVGFKVKVDSDTPVGSVALTCGGSTETQRLSSSDTVARFEHAKPGTCEVRIDAAVPMTAPVSVSEVGGDIRCVVRAGRLACS